MLNSVTPKNEFFGLFVKLTLSQRLIGYLQGLLLADRRLRGWFGVGMGDGGYANLHVHRRTVSCSIIVERLLLTHG